MKKKLIALSIGAVLVFSCASCGNSETPTAAGGESNTDNAFVSSEAADQGSDEPVSDDTSSAEDALRSDVLVDNKDYQVVYGGLEYTEDDVRMTLSVTNKTDRDMIITIEEIALNGIMSGMPEEHTIGAGQTEELLCFIGYDYHTVSCGLENKDISILEFCIHIRDAETYEDLYKETHVLYPLGEDAAQKKEYTPADTDVVLLDNDVCTISFLRGEKEDSTYYVYLYIENKSDHTLSFEFPKGAVNGISTSVTDSIPKVTAGNAMYYTPSFWSLIEDGITDVETIELPVVAYSIDNFAEPAVEETFTITP